jgi:hypothetical protein
VTLPAAVAAEVRFIESGRRAFLDTAAHCFTVRSESGERTYQVTIASQGAELRGSCTCPAGRHARHGTQVPCRHSAGVLRRLERERLATFDGRRWVIASKLAEAV